MAKIKYAHRATEMIPRMMFSAPIRSYSFSHPTTYNIRDMMPPQMIPTNIPSNIINQRCFMLLTWHTTSNVYIG